MTIRHGRDVDVFSFADNARELGENKSRYLADGIVAIGYPLDDIPVFHAVDFVMKDGVVYKD